MRRRPLVMPNSSGKPFPVALATLVLGALAPSCAGPDVDSGEWFEIGTVVALRDETLTPEVEDALGWSLGGGVDLTEGPWRVGPELFATGSNHDVEGGPLASGGDLDAFTYSLGMRVARDLPGTTLGLHLRGGVFYRDEQDRGGAMVAEDQGGTYVGAGLEWWYEPYNAITLGVLHLRRAEDDQEETAVVLSARFSFGRSLGL